jgi:capsular exopolysaccharide synthesis family protein
VVDAAHTLPGKASKKLIPFGAALLLGLILPAGFIYGRDAIRHTISNRRELERLTNVPVIAEFSYVKLPSEIVFDNKPGKDSFILVEQFRNLRTQLNSLNPDETHGFCTIITSSTANEGKSFISTNLAVSLANSGRKTVLLEMDIYQPKVSAAFKLQGSPGITDVLNGVASLKEVIQRSVKYPNLYIIPSGNFIDNFSELLDQPIFQNVLAELKGEFEHILFDAAPVHAINDGYLIAAKCNVSLYLVRHDFTSQSLVPFIKKLGAEEKLPGMNIVFNGLPAGRDSEGYRYENYYRGTA